MGLFNPSMTRSNRKRVLRSVEKGASQSKQVCASQKMPLIEISKGMTNNNLKIARTMAFLIILLMFVTTLSGCQSSNERNYEQGQKLLTEYTGASPEAAKKRARDIFAELDDYKDSAKYVEYCNALLMGGDIDSLKNQFDAFYNLGDFLNSKDSAYDVARSMLTQKYYQEARNAYTKLADHGDPPNGYPIPADQIAEIDKIVAENAQAEVEQAKQDAEDAAARVAKNQPLEEMYNYWAEQVDQGNNPKNLTENPMDIEAIENDSGDSPSAIGYYLTNDEYKDVYSDWRWRRISSMQSAVMGWTYDDYFSNSGTGSVSAITGNGVWIVGDFGKNSTFILENLPLFFIADKPENARYLVYCSDRSYKANGTYFDGATGYSDTATISIIDRVTSTTIFSNTYTSNPGNFKQGSGDVYASVELDHTVQKEIFLKLNDLYNEWQ